MARKNRIKIYLEHNEAKTFVAERFIRTLKNKIYDYMSSISKNGYIDKLDDTLITPMIYIIEELKWNQLM